MFRFREGPARVDRFDLIITASKREESTRRTTTHTLTTVTVDRDSRTNTHVTPDRQTVPQCGPECRRVKIMAILALDPPIRDCLSLRPRRPRRPRHTTAAWKLDSRLLLASSFSEASRRQRPPRRGSTLLRHPRLSALATALRGGRQLLKRALEHLTHVAAADEQEGAILAAG